MVWDVPLPDGAEEALAAGVADVELLGRRWFIPNASSTSESEAKSVT